MVQKHLNSSNVLMSSEYELHKNIRKDNESAYILITERRCFYTHLSYKHRVFKGFLNDTESRFVLFTKFISLYLVLIAGMIFNLCREVGKWMI